MVDPDGPWAAPAIAITYTPGNDVDGPGTFADPGDVFDPYVRTISNLIVDQTLGNPSAILTALQRAGIDDPGLVDHRADLGAYAPLKPLFKRCGGSRARSQASRCGSRCRQPGQCGSSGCTATASAALAAAQRRAGRRCRRTRRTDALLELLTASSSMAPTSIMPNVAPDEGLSAPFNSWFTLFGQFFDHGLDLVNKGGSGTVFIPLQPDDPLYVATGSHTNFMVLTRATTSPGADGVIGDNPRRTTKLDDGRPVNTTTSFVDQNQTYTSHPSHQVFLRQYVLDAAGDPVATGKLIEGANGGMATWGEVKAQAGDMLGIQLTDYDVGNVPLLRTDPTATSFPGANGFPQLIIGIGPDGIPEHRRRRRRRGQSRRRWPARRLGTAVPAVRTGHAFLADIAHNAVPTASPMATSTIGLANPGNGDGGIRQRAARRALHRRRRPRQREHRPDRRPPRVPLPSTTGWSSTPRNRCWRPTTWPCINEWLAGRGSRVPERMARSRRGDRSGIDALVWDGERLFQAAKFGTEMQYQHLVFEEFARKIQPNINVFLVPDGFDTTIDPSIVAEFAHVVYRFGHSMLTESIDRFDPTSRQTISA